MTNQELECIDSRIKIALSKCPSCDLERTGSECECDHIGRVATELLNCDDLTKLVAEVRATREAPAVYGKLSDKGELKP